MGVIPKLHWISQRIWHRAPSGSFFLNVILKLIMCNWKYLLWVLKTTFLFHLIFYAFLLADWFNSHIRLNLSGVRISFSFSHTVHYSLIGMDIVHNTSLQMFSPVGHIEFHLNAKAQNLKQCDFNKKNLMRNLMRKWQEFLWHLGNNFKPSF